MEELLWLEARTRWFSKGGERVPADEFFEFSPKLPRPKEPVPVYLDMKRLPESSHGIDEWQRREAKGGARFMNGDTLLARITPCLENRKTGYVNFLAAGQIGIGSTEFIVIRSRAGMPKPASYFLAVDQGFRDFAIRHMAGTSGRQRVSSSDVSSYEIPLPDERWLSDFGCRVEQQFEFMKSVRGENRTLAATRDALLPQLMSGKLRVRDAEKIVEEVA
jgi:type I restriction enzyme S subunit